MTLRDHQGILDGLRADVRVLAQSDTYRRRMTYVAQLFISSSSVFVLSVASIMLIASSVFFSFIACQQALILPGPDGQSAVSNDDSFWETLVGVANDSIVGVRIGVARLVGLMYRECYRWSIFLVWDLTV